MGCKKLALYPEKTAVIWSIYKSGEHQKNHVNWCDYGARFYDAQIARFHTVDLLSEVYSFQSPFAYAANDPIQYIDYMGMGPMSRIRGWSIWDNIKGWIRRTFLNQTSAGIPLVEPEREEIEVILTEREYIYHGSAKRDEYGDNWNYGDSIKPPHFSSFDYSNRKHIRGQGVLLNSRYPGIQVSQDRRKIFGRTKRVVIGPPDDAITRRVYSPIRRFLGLNMGNRIYVSFYGVYPPDPVFDTHIIALGPIYYQKVLRMVGTHAYFKELERAGIIEPLGLD